MPEPNKQDKSIGIMILFAFNSAGNSICHDHRGYKQVCDHLPYIISKMRRLYPPNKLRSRLRPALSGRETTGKCKNVYLKIHPTTTLYPIANARGSDNRNHTDHLSYPLISGADLRTFTECFDRSVLFAARPKPFPRSPGRSDQNNKQNIWKQERHSTPF